MLYYIIIYIIEKEKQISNETYRTKKNEYRHKPNYINNNIKCGWLNLSNQRERLLVWFKKKI